MKHPSVLITSDRILFMAQGVLATLLLPHRTRDRCHPGRIAGSPDLRGQGLDRTRLERL